MDKSIFRSIPSQPVKAQQLQTTKHQKVSSTFSYHFQNAIQENKPLTVSKHANERLQQRGIHINENRWQIIEEKVLEAKKMGVKDSLVLLSDAALIVSAKNNTVITAMDRSEALTQIFTNINGTIVLD